MKNSGITPVRGEFLTLIDKLLLELEDAKKCKEGHFRRLLGS